MQNTWKAVLGVVLIFFLGWLSGVLSSSLYLRHRVLEAIHRGPDAVAEVLERRTTHDLHLDDSQRGQIHDIILKNLQERHRLQVQLQPEIRADNKETMKEIESVLRPDQVDLFHQNIVDFRKRFGKNPFNPNADAPPAPADAPSAAPH